MDNCIICKRSLSEPRLAGDVEVNMVVQPGQAHLSCYRVLAEIEAEEARAETERRIKLARERLK